MLKLTQIYLGMILIMLSTATATFTQETTEKPKENIANSSRQIPSADDLDECAKLLEKSVEANKTANGLIKNLETEIAERKKLQTITDEEIKSLRNTIDALKYVISEQQKLIEILMKQSKTKIKICLAC